MKTEKIKAFICENLHFSYLADSRLESMDPDNLTHEDITVLCALLDLHADPDNLEIQADENMESPEKTMALYCSALQEIIEICDEHGWELPIMYNIDVWS